MHIRVYTHLFTRAALFFDRKQSFEPLLIKTIFECDFRLEAVHCGCVPIAPNKLVYPEIYPKQFLFNTKRQLVKMLRNWCNHRQLFIKHRQIFFESFSLQRFSSENLIPKYLEILTLKNIDE